MKSNYDLASRSYDLGTETAFTVLAKANKLASEGQNIINQGIGQPDFKTPEHIVEAGIKALRDGHHGYTQSTGIPSLREAVSNDLKKSIGDIKSGLVELKNDKDGNLALSIGRKSFSKEKIQENFKFLMEFLKKEKTESIKGEFIKNIHITSTMGISYKIGSKS